MEAIKHTITCITCNKEKSEFEFSLYDSHRRYEICKTCKEISDRVLAKERIIELKNMPESDLPVYVGHPFKVKPPLMYYEQMCHYAKMIRKGYRLVKMTDRLNKKLREQYTDLGLTSTPYPVRTNKRGVTLWKKDKDMEDISVVILYTLAHLIKRSRWQDQLDSRLAHVKRRPMINYRRAELRERKIEALTAKVMPAKVRASIKAAKSVAVVDNILKLWTRKTKVLETKGITPKIKISIMAAKSTQEVDKVLKAWKEEKSGKKQEAK